MKSIFKQTGWKRPFYKTICQDFDVLASVKEYDYDLYDVKFADYCERRGVLYKAGEKERFEFTANHKATKEEFFSQFSHSIAGYKYNKDEMEFHWKIMLAAKGAMQDCWEVYNQQ